MKFVGIPPVQGVESSEVFQLQKTQGRFQQMLQPNINLTPKIHPASVHICKKDVFAKKALPEAFKTQKASDLGISYEEATEKYHYFKQITTKKYLSSATFTHDLKMREHYLAIKKRYDMRRRAKKFRDNQKKEVQRLRAVVEKDEELNGADDEDVEEMATATVTEKEKILDM